MSDEKATHVLLTGAQRRLLRHTVMDRIHQVSNTLTNESIVGGTRDYYGALREELLTLHRLLDGDGS